MRSWLIGLTGLTWFGCGGGHRPAVQYGEEIKLEPVVDGQQWYRAQTTCAQGPFELEVPATGARHGEDVELRLHTARAIALHAVVLVDDKQVDTEEGVWDQGGASSGHAQNVRCVADAKEKLLLGRPGGGGGGGTGTVAPPGRLVVDPPPAQVQTPQLTVDTGFDGDSIEVLKLRVPDGARRVRIKLWSIEPNDLDGVLFGIAHVEWRPNVGEERYQAWIRENEERERQQAEQQWRAAEEYARAHPAKVVVVDVAAEQARARAEAKRREDAQRRREIAAALELDRRRRRAEFCAAHHEDRGCWGAGGFAMNAEFARHDAEKAAYCAAHTEDARCWTEEERARRRGIWDARVAAATAAPRPPDGPPPAPLAEDIPPKLSEHAEWRAGYWDWVEGQWVWLAGMWRVPDSDIAAETTTIAPAAPPEVKVEAPPPAPVRAAVWVPGFWQWSGSGWVWIAGSWQLRPAASVTWRVPEWRPRGNVHVLIPGGWIRIGGGR